MLLLFLSLESTKTYKDIFFLCLPLLLSLPFSHSQNMGFQSGSVVKNLLANERDAGLIPGSGRSAEEGNSNTL